MTEKEAKTKWCPLARLSEMGGTYNRTGPEANLQCIGSACMAWRTKEGVSARSQAFVTVGYCGAFGEPR